MPAPKPTKREAEIYKAISSEYIGLSPVAIELLCGYAASKSEWERTKQNLATLPDDSKIRYRTVQEMAMLGNQARACLAGFEKEAANVTKTEEQEEFADIG